MKIMTIMVSVLLLAACAGEAKQNDTTSNEVQETQNDNSTIPEKTLEGDPVQTSSNSAELESTGKKEIGKESVIKKIGKDGKVSEIRPEITQSDAKVEVQKTEEKIPKEDFSGVFNQILNNFVSSSGKVNYAGIKTNRTMLIQATQYFEENPPQSSWSSNQKLAYWINAYNLYTIELVVDNYPVSSIKDINGGKPWDKKFIKLDGRTLSLNDIENNIIRKDFNEPRIHFAVNCASISCPKLLNKAYTAGNLNSLLESQAKRFINDNSMNSLGAKSIEISNIFNWYKVDFVKSGTVIDYLNKYANTTINSDAKITYKDYNWNLNN